MNILIKKNDYLSFLRSKLKSRIDFLERYSVLIPEYIDEDHIKYLKSITLSDLSIQELNEIEGRVIEIEEYISNSFKNITINSMTSYTRV